MTPGVGHGPQEGWVVGSGCPSRCRRCHWTRIAVLRVCGPPVGLVVLSPRPSSPFVALVPGNRPGCRSAAPRGEACRNGPCLGRCTPCGWGSVYACTVRRLWIDSWFGPCSPFVVTGPGLVLGRRRLPVLCGCSMCFGYTPCGPGSGYAGVSRYLRSGLWHCSRYVVIGFGLVPVLVGVVSLPPVLSPPPGVRVCRLYCTAQMALFIVGQQQPCGGAGANKMWGQVTLGRGLFYCGLWRGAVYSCCLVAPCWLALGCAA